jgi:hypothetical protein
VAEKLISSFSANPNYQYRKARSITSTNGTNDFCHVKYITAYKIFQKHFLMPNATRVASYKLWNEKFGRHVKKGEKSLRIFAPIEIKPEKKLTEKLDPETGAPMVDANGKAIMEEMTALSSRSIAFKLVPVFDVSQTYGEPLPQLAEDLTGHAAHYEAFLDSLKAVLLHKLFIRNKRFLLLRAYNANAGFALAFCVADAVAKQIPAITFVFETTRNP